VKAYEKHLKIRRGINYPAPDFSFPPKTGGSTDKARLLKTNMYFCFNGNAKNIMKINN